MDSRDPDIAVETRDTPGFVDGRHDAPQNRETSELFGFVATTKRRKDEFDADGLHAYGFNLSRRMRILVRNAGRRYGAYRIAA